MMASKGSLRRSMLLQLKSLSPSQLNVEAASVAANLASLPCYDSAQVIGLYLSMRERRELPTDALLHDAWARGKVVVVPRIIGERQLQFVRVKCWDEIAAMPLDKWSIPIPPAQNHDDDDYEHRIDLLVVPGLAFTRDGRRLGRGGGFYDTFVQTLVERGQDPLLVGVGASVQLVDEVPAEAHDLIVDYVCTGDQRFNTRALER
jgi:5-formyltetrahydrofolate cyclo-ligase